jgi:subtilase family serine protease
MHTDRRAVIGGVAVLGLAIAALTGTSSPAATGATHQPRARHLVSLANSRPRTTDTKTGAYTSRKMSVEVALAPRHQKAMNARLAAAYNPRSSQYHSWLATGAFNARYAPSAATRRAVEGYLSAHGLVVGRAASPFLVRASGSSAHVSAAFHTQLSTYRGARGKYFANSTSVALPTALATRVQGVIGLTNTVRAHSSAKVAPQATRAASAKSCQAPYPTRRQFFKLFNHGISFPFGYGRSPGCNGLAPSQDNSLYGAPRGGSRVRGAGKTIAVFELSAYQRSDIATYVHHYYGPKYKLRLSDVNVDGGPLHPVCPKGDRCPPKINGYSGDVEVVADIQMQLAIAPAVRQLVVYNAPNDFNGITGLDEYSRIANDNRADSISSSWGLCEKDVPVGIVRAENVVFKQMAMQGQSLFGGIGDTGAFSCIRADGTTVPNLTDPPSQPWVTSTGGTSFERFNPGRHAHPTYPKSGEAVWNTDNLCNASANEGGHSGFFWCAATGATGGGSSQYWGKPSYQQGPGIISGDTSFGNGTTKCSFAKKGTPCRETPDVSADSDPATPYAEYCTGSAATPHSACATIAGKPAGWFGIGGTSLSGPLWAGIAVNRDSFSHSRVGNLNPWLYQRYSSHPRVFFHDVIRKGHIARNNGLYRAKAGFDLATGIGTPKMASLIKKGF